MKFTNIIAVLAITTMGSSAVATDGTLRRTVAQNDDNSGVVILNTNSNTNGNSANANAQQSQSAVAQPTTIVEASSISESKAEALRKARINAEVQTEQKIVEKLEDSRLQEEKARADRLFGNRLDAPAVVQQNNQATVVAPTVVAPVVAPVVTETKATNVTIEKVEIIHPKEEAHPEPVVIAKPEASVAIAAEELNVAKRNSYYVSGLAGNLSYNASNVKTNYGLGFAVGMMFDDQFAVDLSYFYSNSYINTFWKAPLYNQLDQSDITASGKFYFLAGNLRPYIGGSASYIYRNYHDRVAGVQQWAGYQESTESTGAVNLGVLGGVDFKVSRNLSFGGGLAYNFNLMNTNEPTWVSNSYQVPGTTPLEKISYYSLKINATILF